jgi:hypothetical protein
LLYYQCLLYFIRCFSLNLKKEEEVWEAVKKALSVSKEQLTNLELKWPSDSKHTILLLDEAKHLLVPIASTEPLDVPSKFRLFRDALRTLWKKSQIFCVVASTVSAVANFAPPDDFSSIKHLPHGGKLFPPFYALDFFDWERQPTAEVPTGWNDLKDPTIRRLFAQGRPLFDLATRMNLPVALRFVRMKLLGGPSHLFSSVVQSKQMKTPVHVLAFLIASSRSALTYNPHAYFCSHAVASHMAVVGYLSDDRFLLHAGYAPEPFLAEASAHIFHHSCSESASILSSLPQIFTSAPISKGEAGESIARLLVQLAYDRAAIQYAQGYGPEQDKDWALSIPSSGNFLFSQPIPLSAFVRVLCGKEALSKLESFQGFTLSTAEVCFTHVVKLTFTPRSISVLEQAFNSRAILLGKPNQKGFDLLIPVRYVVDNQFKYTCILLQIKNKTTDNVKDALEKLTAEFSFDTQEMKALCPELCIYLNVGCEEEDTATFVEKQVYAFLFAFFSIC